MQIRRRFGKRFTSETDAIMVFLLQYVGSFPVAGADQSARAEYVRSKLLQLRVSSYQLFIFILGANFGSFFSLDRSPV